MLLPLLFMDLQFSYCTHYLERLFQSAIATEHTMGLNNNRNFQHFRNNQADDDAAALNAFGDGQSLIGLEERFEFTMMAGKKLLSYFDHLTSITPEGPHKPAFMEAGEIIKHRLEFLVDSLEFQLPRLKRAKAHTNLNRTGVSFSPSAFLAPIFTPPIHTPLTSTARIPHRLNRQHALLPNSPRIQSRLHSHESHRRTHHVLPPRHLRRRVLRDAPF